MFYHKGLELKGASWHSEEKLQVQQLVQLYVLLKSKSGTNCIQLLGLYLGANENAESKIDHLELIINIVKK